MIQTNIKNIYEVGIFQVCQDYIETKLLSSYSCRYECSFHKHYICQCSITLLFSEGVALRMI